MLPEPAGIVGFGDSIESTSASGEINPKKRKKLGGFQAFALSFPVLKGVLKRGYKVPTPIQRKTIPVALESRDVVAMARTGSGKTASFLLPMFEKLKEHSGSGIRALILSPTRELASQTRKFVKELGRFTSLRSILILGGDPMESQFSSIHSNPDIVVATPGRFLHLCVEMQLKLNTIQYVVFDEADRLFEMGFSEQLTEILARLPNSRQTLLFSATLPKVLLQFAKAGLNDPVLIRLDLESKIPDTLELNFFYCRPEEREAALLCLLKHIVKPKSMIIVFAATKHHVEYLHMMLSHMCISNTYVYSDLDPTARKINLAKFQNGGVNVLIVTDVAARGIDIPQLDYVINFNFPAKPKLFLHRVGRCARAGRKGCAFSLVGSNELCYLLDLHLFLNRPLTVVTKDTKIHPYDDGYFGKIPQTLIEEECTALAMWSQHSSDVEPLKRVCANGYKNYMKSRPAASKDSMKRSKNIELDKMHIHPLFVNICDAESERLEFIKKMKNYKPQTTIFELGQSSNSEQLLQTKLFRKINEKKMKYFRKKKAEERSEESLRCSDRYESRRTEKSEKLGKHLKSDAEHYVPYKSSDSHFEKGVVDDIQVKAADAVLDLIGDSTDLMRTQKKIEKKWDPSKRKYVASNNKEKMIRSESGQWIPVSYKTNHYEKWRERNKEQNMEESDEETKNNLLPTSNYSMRLDTHWGRHNLKMYEKRQKPIIKIDTKQILKQRKLKEKRRLRNGKKTKRTKIKKKSGKFNKV